MTCSNDALAFKLLKINTNLSLKPKLKKLKKGNGVTQSYYCIEDYINIEEMTFKNFDDKKIT